MSSTENHQRKLGLPSVFSIASGAMISSGLFVLPAIIFKDLGPSVVTVYAIAGLLIIPALLAKAELATAMPKSGGTYFFVERSLGPLLGAFAGFASWFSIALKGAFALVGIGTFVSYIQPGATEFTFKIVALCFVLVFTLVNLLGSHGSAKSQVAMVVGLLGILLAYIFGGWAKGSGTPITEFIPKSTTGLFTAVGMVFVSFGGLTKVAAVAHEIKDPGTTLPKGMFLSFIVVILIYLAAIAVTIGLLSAEQLSSTLTPLSEGGFAIAGRTGGILLAAAALLAFATTANASILSASQNPAAMAHDGLVPEWLGRTNNRGVPVLAVLLTGGFMAIVILALNLANLVKAASTMMLILFLLDNLALILMRESRIVSYRPLYKSPLYPLLPIAGILLSGFLIYSMGPLPLALTGAFFLLTTVFTLTYKKDGRSRDSALFRIVERMAAREVRGARLSEELGDILLERDGVSEDRFDRLVRKAIVLDLPGEITRDQLFEKLAGAFTLRLDASYEDVLNRLKAREEESTTLLSDDLAIPHIVLDDTEGFEIVMVRAKNGVLYEEGRPEPKVVFALAGSATERNFHLQSLMAIAQITQTPDFLERWISAFDEEELRLLILLAERTR
ncbi:MAG: amino acid permease [Spirochaetales bacterium]|nr:amino acid permease [Spirochaetales bacterium]